MANPTTNYGWVLPTSTDLVTDLPADFDVALQGVDTTTKALNPATTLGDLQYRSATANTNTRLGIGTTGQVLTVSGGVPAWTTPASGGSMTLLSTTTLSGTSVTVSSISQSYKDLLIMVESPRWGTGSDDLQIKLNNSNGGAFASGAVESSSGTFTAYGINGGVLSFNNGQQDQSSYGGFYCTLVKDYTATYGGNTSGKPLQYWGTLVSGDQRSFNLAGAFVNSIAVFDIRASTSFQILGTHNVSNPDNRTR